MFTQGPGTAQDTLSQQAQPRSPARAAFLSAWGALARLAGGTPPQTATAAAETGATSTAGSAGSDSGATAALSYSNKDPANSAAQPIPVAGGRVASRAASAASAANPGAASVATPAGGDSGISAAVGYSNRDAADSAAQLVPVAGAAAADAGDASMAAPAGSHSSITAAQSTNNKDPADSAAELFSVAGAAPAAATATVSDRESSGNEAAATPEAVLVGQAPGTAGVGASMEASEAGAMLAAPAFRGAAEARRSSAEVSAALITAAAHAGTAPDSPAAVLTEKSDATASKDSARLASVHAANLDEQATASATATAATSPEPIKKPAADSILPSGSRQSPAAQHIGLPQAEPEEEAAAAASNVEASSREQATSAGHDAEPAASESSSGPGGDDAPRTATQARLQVHLDDEASSEHPRASCLYNGMFVGNAWRESYGLNLGVAWHIGCACMPCD